MLNQCACKLFLYFLWHTWRVNCFEEWTQTLASVFTIVKSTSAWSASPGPYLLTYTWCTVQHMAMAGKHKDFVTSFFWTEGVQILYVCICWLLPAGNWYICSEQAQHRARMIVRTSQFDEDIWEHSLHKHLHSWSHIQCGSSSCLELCTGEAALAFPSVGAGCRPWQLPSSKPILRWFVHQSTEKPDVSAMVLFMDKTCFTWEGIFSSHNSHIYVQANPLAASNNALWSMFGWAVCMTFWLTLLVTLTAQWTDLPRVSVAHFACQVWEHLTATYNDRWIGWGRPVAWLPTSPDLTPTDFFLWGHMTALIDKLPVDSEEYLIVHIIEAVATVMQKPGIFECTHQSLLRCCQLCIEVDGHMFEHVL